MGKLSQTKVSVLDQFEARSDNWSFGEFERALEAAMGSRYGNYQTAKMTIKDADSEGKWPITVKRYVLTNYKAMGSSPGELIEVCRRLISSMSDEERAEWGIEPKA